MMNTTNWFAVAATVGLLVSCGGATGVEPLRPAASDPRFVRILRDHSAWRSRQPAHGKPSSFAPPTPVEIYLSSGMRVLVVENHEQPLIAIRWIAPIGASDVSSGKQGLANVLAKMLAEGAGRRDAATLAVQERLNARSD